MNSSKSSDQNSSRQKGRINLSVTDFVLRDESIRVKRSDLCPKEAAEILCQLVRFNQESIRQAGKDLRAVVSGGDWSTIEKAEVHGLGKTKLTSRCYALSDWSFFQIPNQIPPQKGGRNPGMDTSCWEQIKEPSFFAVLPRGKQISDPKILRNQFASKRKLQMS